VEELFEARKPKSSAIISHIDGLISFEKDPKGNDFVHVTNNETGEVFEKQVVYGSTLRVSEGDYVTRGTHLTEGSAEPSEILQVNGELAVQDYLIQEVQRVYRTQGVDINDKHIEVIIRQMMRKIKIDDQGSTGMISGSVVSKAEFEAENARIEALNAEDGGDRKPATKTPLLLGITKASLATESFRSAAAFQETTRVLTEAAILGKVDPLVGLKENVIIGKLIPAGTGTVVYNKYKKERAELMSEYAETLENAAEDQRMEGEPLQF
jgi:DNA-directed RNA polymerase subunit beta'